MKTTLKLIASAVSLCVTAPAAYAISSDQAAANLKGALEFDHFAQKNYAAALRAERVTNVDMMNVIHQYQAGSPEAAAAARTHLDALNLISQRRNEVKFAQTQLQAARNAFKDGSIAPTAIPVAPMPQPLKAPPLPVQAVPPKPVVYNVPQPIVAPPKLAYNVPVKPQMLTTTNTPQPIVAPPTPIYNVPVKPQTLTTTSTPQPIVAPPAPTYNVPVKPQTLTTISTTQPIVAPPTPTYNVPPKPQTLTTNASQPIVAPPTPTTPLAPAYEIKTIQPILSLQPAAGDIPSPQPLPTTTVQVVNQQTMPTTLVKGMPDNTVINAQKADTGSVTLVDSQTTPLTVTSAGADAQPSAPAKKTASTSQTADNSYTVRIVSEVNSYYVDQTNRNQIDTNGQRIASNSQRIETNGQNIDNNSQRISGNSLRIDNNSQRISGNSQRIDNNSQRIDSNSQRITRNSQSIERNAKEIDDTREDLKRGLNNAAAMSSLHYHSDNSWALSTGTANGDGAALAAGLQKGVTPHVAVNMQASSSFDNGWMAGAGISGDF